MTERRQYRITRSTRAKQKTLYELFHKDEETEPSEQRSKELDKTEAIEPEVASRSSNLPLDIIVIDDEQSPPRSKESHRVIRDSNNSQSTNLFPIFGRPSMASICVVHSTSGVDNTDNGGDTSLESSYHEQLSSSHQSSSLPPHPAPHSLNQSYSTPILPYAEGVNTPINGSTLFLTQDIAVRKRTYISGDSHPSVKRHVPPGDMSPDTPYPDKEMQHVRGPQNAFSASSEPPKRHKRSLPDPTDDVSLTFLSSMSQGNRCQHPPLEPLIFPRIISQSQHEDYLGVHGPRDAALYPAISRFLGADDHAIGTTSGPVQHEIWTTRFRPKHAKEVLGNESHALYIRDWLKALEIHLHATNPPVAKGSKNGRGKQKSNPGLPDRAPKRPRVVRAVNKHRGRKRQRVDSEDELDAFIAHSDAEDHIISDEPEREIDDDDFMFSQISHLQQKGNSRLSFRPRDHPAPPEIDFDTIPTNSNHRSSDADFTNSLTNTLLITGPPGCGKSAAVYACAEELGWEVFEVYPGIGRRSGTNIDNLVGDVGKNHLIQQTRPSRRRAATQCDSSMSTVFSTLVPKGGNVHPKPSPKHSNTEHPIDVDTHVLVGAASNSLQDVVEPPVAIDWQPSSLKTNGRLKPSARQSLILLEEVDILFKEDAGFWPAVVELIKECRRPVIMTCNDIQLVPTTDLPLQTVLKFKPCPSRPAVTYLQCLCLTAGCAIPRESLMHLYQTTYTTQRMDIPDAPLNPNTEPLPLPDFRRSITQLQLICIDAINETKITRVPHGAVECNNLSLPLTISAQHSAEVSTTSTEELWRWISDHADCASYIDSYLCRTPLDEHEALSYNLTESSLDDELGHAILFRPSYVSGTKDVLAFYHHDELIVQDAIHLARGKHEVMGTIPIATSINNTDIETSLFQARVAYQVHMSTALHGIIQPPAPLMPQSSVYLDYIPWVRFMVTVDDDLERLAWDEMEKEKSGRLTRNSMKAKHTRVIDLSEDQHRALVATRMQC